MAAAGGHSDPVRPRRLLVHAHDPWPVPVLLMLVSVFAARAWLATVAQQGEEIGARRWFVYPPLVALYTLACECARRMAIAADRRHVDRRSSDARQDGRLVRRPH
jgi:hypothetical protein